MFSDGQLFTTRGSGATPALLWTLMAKVAGNLSVRRFTTFHQRRDDIFFFFNSRHEGWQAGATLQYMKLMNSVI